MSSMTGGEVLAKMLQLEGVTKVFGIIDGTYYGFYSCFDKYGIELITPRHETCAAHMAGAYARLTGKLGVCMASNGPGVANILPGVAVENAEGNRVLLVTSTRRPSISYPDRGGAYQLFDQVGVISPMAKWSATVRSFDRIQELTRRALRIAFQGRPGVVNIEIPENIMNGSGKPGPFLKPAQYRRIEPLPPSPKQVEAAAAMLAGASCPIIHAGSGIVHAQAFQELETVATMLHAPVVTSWGARGALPETSPLACSMIYVKANSWLRKQADVVLTLGSRLGETDFWGKAPYWARPGDQQMIQVDIEPEILGMNKPTALAIQADVGVFLTQLAALLKQRAGSFDLTARKKVLAKYRTKAGKFRKKIDKHLEDDGCPMNPARVATICQTVFPKNAITIFDGGNTQVWGNFYHEVRMPNTQLGTHKFGMLGAGVSQTLGAAVAKPDVPVYCIIGDGAMGFHVQEIETAVRNKLPVIYLVLCDRQWGMVKTTQQFMKSPLKTALKKPIKECDYYNADLDEIKFDELAKSMGAHGERVASASELEGALKRCLSAKKCAVIHVDVDRATHMFPPGLIYFKKMHQEPKGK